jgi:hypothetical protein
MFNKELLVVLANIRIWEELRQIHIVNLDSEFGIPYIKAGGIIQINGYHSHDNMYFVRSVSHSISKSSGYRVSLTGELLNPNMVVKVLNKDGGYVYDPIKKTVVPSLDTGTNIDTTIDANCPEEGLLFPADGTYDHDAYYCHKMVDGSWMRVDCSLFREDDDSYYKSYFNRFGDRVHPTRNEMREHTGIDIDGLINAELYAAADGIVTEKGYDGGYGNYLVICLDRKFKVGDTSELQDEGGIVGRNGAWYIRYAHLSKYADGIGINSHVGKGQVIGYMGDTGTSTQPHLHFELYKNTGKGNEFVNPISCIVGYNHLSTETDEDDSTDLSGMDNYVNVFIRVFDEDGKNIIEDSVIRLNNRVLSLADGGFVALEKKQEYDLVITKSGYEIATRKLYYDESTGQSKNEDIYMQKIEDEPTSFVNVEVKTFNVAGSEIKEEILVYVNDTYVDLAPVVVKLKVDNKAYIRIGSENYEYSTHEVNVIKEYENKVLRFTCEEK